MSKEYFKVAKLDGTPFHDGQSINYRASIGKTVRLQEPQFSAPAKLCTNSVLHASEKVLDALSYGQIPCSIYKVQGKPVAEDSTKCGFKKLKVVEEIPASEFDKLLGFKYLEVVNPFDPRTVRAHEVTKEDLVTLKRWDSVRDSVWGSVRDSVWGSVWDSVWDSVWGSVWDSVWGSVWGSVWDSVRGSVRGSVYAYLGTLFPSVKEWKYTEKLPDFAKKGYPFQSCVDLIHRGLVPATDGKKWYLVGYPDGKKASILWEGKVE